MLGVCCCRSPGAVVLCWWRPLLRCMAGGTLTALEHDVQGGALDCAVQCIGRPCLPALVLYGLFIFRAYAAVQRECVRIFRISFFVANRTEEEEKYLLLMAGSDRGRSFWRALYIMSVCFACCLSGPRLGMSTCIVSAGDPSAFRLP